MTIKTTLRKNLRTETAIVLFFLLISPALYAEFQHYQFTGTIEETDPEIPFASPESSLPGSEVSAGESVRGSFTLDTSFFSLGLAPGAKLAIGSVTDFKLIIKGENIMPDLAHAGDSWVLDDQSEPILSPAFPLESGPTAGNPGDAITITSINDGLPLITEDGSKFSVTLNFTDSSGTILNGPQYPRSIDLSKFDIAKGFIPQWDDQEFPKPLSRGIMFNIDSLEEFNPEAPASVVLSTGFHVSWPADTDGYTLETATAPDGPWTPYEGSPVLVADQYIAIMDMRQRNSFFRLVRPD